jgi:serine/threonine protein kinase
MSAPASEPAISGSLPVGASIAARYLILEVLGDGASGIVYRTEHVGSVDSGEGASLRPGQAVALKVIHRHLARDHQISRRFHREARILRKLRGPNLVPLLDFGETDDGLLYMALEYVEGTPLDVLCKKGRLPASRAVGIVKQICCALEVAHAAGVIHRDLKPGNVIIEHRPEDVDHVRVLDFGLAKMLHGESLTQSLTALTQQNMVFGTPEYMAPEQARGDDLDERCDVYALGIILYELLTGAVPFTGKGPIFVMTAHLTETPRPLSDQLPVGEIAPALEAVVMHALSKAPSERYPSSTALATALSSALDRPSDLESAAPPPSDEEIGTRDTELSLEPVPMVPDAGTSQAPPQRKLWFVVVLVAIVVGIFAGIALSLSGR